MGNCLGGMQNCVRDCCCATEDPAPVQNNQISPEETATPADSDAGSIYGGPFPAEEWYRTKPRPYVYTPRRHCVEMHIISDEPIIRSNPHILRPNTQEKKDQMRKLAAFRTGDFRPTEEPRLKRANAIIIRAKARKVENGQR